MLSITAFCSRIYGAGRRLSSFKLTCDVYGLIPVVSSTSEQHSCKRLSILYTSGASRCWCCEGYDSWELLEVCFIDGFVKHNYVQPLLWIVWSVIINPL